MKLSYKIIIALLFLFISLPIKANCFASANAISYYAKILEDGVILYQEADENLPIFNLPKTYFVELFYASGDYYYARYDDIFGFVKKEQVKAISGKPINPFLTNISFRIFVPSGANLRSSPQNDGANNLILTIPFLDSNISYYGTIAGEEAISKKGTIWFYCKYYSNNSSFNGYVYSALTDCLDTILENNEELEYLDGELDFSPNVEPTSTDPISSMSQTAQTLIIIAISLPCLFFIYLLFKPTMIAETSQKSKSKTNKKKAKISRLKHSDYFEFNDDDLD